MGRSYKLFSTAATTTNAAASLRVTKNATIRCILFSIATTAGAGVAGLTLAELSKQNVGSFTVNDTPDTVLATVGVPAPVSGGANVLNVGIICSLPVSVGDTLYLNITHSGTGLASAAHNVTIYTD